MIDASLPLTILNREVLKRLCDISFYNHSLLYIALNKVDLVSPKDKLLQYSNDISELVWKTKIALLQQVDLRGWSEVDGRVHNRSEAMGE